jgi:hypothetical protein
MPYQVSWTLSWASNTWFDRNLRFSAQSSIFTRIC